MVVGDADLLHPQRDGPVYLCPDRRLAVPGKLSVHVKVTDHSRFSLEKIVPTFLLAVVPLRLAAL